MKWDYFTYTLEDNLSALLTIYFLTKKKGQQGTLKFYFANPILVKYV